MRKAVSILFLLIYLLPVFSSAVPAGSAADHHGKQDISMYEKASTQAYKNIGSHTNHSPRHTPKAKTFSHSQLVIVALPHLSEAMRFRPVMHEKYFCLNTVATKYKANGTIWQPPRNI